MGPTIGRRGWFVADIRRIRKVGKQRKNLSTNAATKGWARRPFLPKNTEGPEIDFGVPEAVLHRRPALRSDGTGSVSATLLLAALSGNGAPAVILQLLCS